MTLNELIRFAILTVRQPDTAMAVLRGFDLPLSARWMALLLAVSLSSLLMGVLSLGVEEAAGDPLGALADAPLKLAALQFLGMSFFAFMMAQVGRLFGGHGDFPDALLTVAWIELILIVTQAICLAVALILPPLGLIMIVLAYGMAFYLILRLTQALHGFQNTFLVLLGFIGALFVVSFALSILASFLGIMPELPTNDV